MAVSENQRRRILNDVQENWRALLDAVDVLDEETLEQPDIVGIWSIKDVLGHVSTWERVAMERIRLAEQGVRRRLVPNIQQFNREESEAKRSSSLAEVRRELNATHRELVALLESSPALTRDLIRADTYGHYQEHLRDIQAGLSKRSAPSR